MRQTQLLGRNDEKKERKKGRKKERKEERKWDTERER